MFFKVCVEVPEQGHEVGASPPPEVEKLRQAEERLEGYQRATTALREALEAKGASLGEGAPLEDYATAVESLLDPLPPIKIVNGNNFSGWTGLTALPPLDVTTLTNAYCLAYRCTSLKSVSLDLPKATNCEYLLDGCTSLQSATLNLPECTNAKSLLNGCTRLTELQLSASKCVTAESMLNGCTRLKSVTLNLPELTNAYCLAYRCTSLKSVSLDLPKATNCEYLLDGCTSLQSATLNLPECTNAKSLLNGCTRLTELHITGLKCSLSLLGTAVGVDSVRYIVEHAQEALEGAVLTLPRAMEAKLDEETMETAISKGFDVAFR